MPTVTCAAAGLRIIRDAQIDLVFFSTTMFLCMPLGRVWRRKTKTPFVVDLQDPWASDYRPHDGAAPRKYGLARRVHARLEPWTMKRASGVIAVSPAYIETIRRRYPWIAEDACATIPFGVALEDFAAAARVQPAIRREPLRLTGVYVGAGGPAMATSLRILFAAVARLHAIDSALAEKLRLAFIGTDYAPAGITAGRPSSRLPPKPASGLRSPSRPIASPTSWRSRRCARPTSSS